MGVFLSQRLTNAVGKNNMSLGLRSIFQSFLPLVYRAVGSPAGAER
jgi:hypothetical protein